MKTQLTEKELLDRYDAMLDESYGEVSICGYTYTASHALKLVDPTAYRCGYVDWLDAELTGGEIEEDDNGEYYCAQEGGFVWDK